MGKQPLILIVDDDEILLESIADLLLLSDFQVVTAGNGVEALSLLQTIRPDCIVSDVMMPEIDGYGLLAAIRSNEQWAAIPVILITAYDRPPGRDADSSIVPDAFLTKPFDVDDLVELIGKLLQ